MASIQDFVAEVERMPGVKGCLLVTADGRTLTQTLPNAERTGSMVVLVQMAAHNVRTILGLERLRHMVLGGNDTSCLMVFPLGRYLLTVEQTPQPGIDLPRAVHDLVGHYQRQKD